MQAEAERPARYSLPRGGYVLAYLWKYNEYRVDGAVAHLILRDNNGVPKGEATIDADDVERVLEAAYWTRQSTKTPGLYYAKGTARGEGLPVGQRKPTLYLHRFVTDAPPGAEVDHDNGDGLDCRKENLRLTDRIGNQNNRHQQRRERQLEEVIRGLLACACGVPDCPCRLRARAVLPV